MNYLIEEVKCDVCKEGVAFGLIGGPVVATIKYNDGKESKWLTNIEVDGIASFCLTDRDIFEDALKEDFRDEEFYDYINEHFIDEFDNMALFSDYDKLMDSINNCNDKNTAKFIKYLIVVTRCDFDELDSIIGLGLGRNISDVDVPKCDFE